VQKMFRLQKLIIPEVKVFSFYSVSVYSADTALQNFIDVNFPTLSVNN